MNRDQEEPFDRDQPTLVVTYGNTTRKYRPLDREVIVLGRSPKCDLNLLGAGVALIHCLLVRCPGGGWRVRHFGGRIGTFVNGKRIRDAALDHDDTLQIGSFSFKLHLPLPFRRPGLKADTPPDSAEASHLRRSRRNLVRLALSLRASFHQTAEELARAEQRLEQQAQDLDDLHASARARQQALDTIRAKREAEESALAARSEALDQREAALEARSQEVVQNERPLSACSGEEQRLNQRGVELALYARHLRRLAKKVAEREAEVSRRSREVGRERDQLARERGESRRPLVDEAVIAPTLSERLERVQKLKKGLSMLRSCDSAPGVSLNRTPAGPHPAAAVAEHIVRTPN